MLVATFAKRIGKTVAFALAAFRQAYAGGRALSVRDNVLIAAAACEIHPTAILRAAATRGVRERARARERRAPPRSASTTCRRCASATACSSARRRSSEAGALLAAARA